MRKTNKSKKEKYTPDEIITKIDFSKADFSILNDNKKLKWVDTSQKKHNEKRIKAYDKDAY